MATERVLIIKAGARFERRPLEVGQEYAVPDWFAASLFRSKTAVPATGPINSLPEDFPGRAQLAAAGFTTIEAVRAIADFDEFKGIGQATERKIVAYLEQLTTGGSDV